MEKKLKYFYLLLTVSALAIICSVTFIYVRQLNRTISDNIINTISEIAEHDKSALQTYIEICWEDLTEIQERFVSYGCETVADIESRMELECEASSFAHIYLLAEDGTFCSDQCSADAFSTADNGAGDFMSYFAKGEEKVVARFDGWEEEDGLNKKRILYGVRLQDYEVEGKRMLAMIGVSDISSIRDRMVINSYVKNGESRGHSALIDMSGNYIVDINKEGYRGKYSNLFEHLAEAESSEMTNEEVAEKLENLETFAFYHSHEGEEHQELFYFIPFEKEMHLYFIMSLNEAVFTEQSNTFVTMSMIMLVLSMLTVAVMLLIVMKYQNRTLIASERARSQKEFLSNMSHEIRTPLNGLIGMNHLIMVHIDDEGHKGQIKEWLRKSQSTANYLLSLVNDILDMSKLQAGKVDIIKEPLLVSAMIDEIAAMQADNIESRGVEFIVEKTITVPCVEGDVTRTKQILMNIVGNAAKFTPKGKWIRLSVSQEQTDEQHVVTTYRCEDAGIGISREYIDKIFDSFSQERHRHTEGTKGTGLGMAISKLLANAMGGDITVESELDVGSTFTVTIPSVIVEEIPEYLQEEEEEYGAGDSEKESGQEGRQVKIMVVEDVDLNAEVLLEILAMEGFETAHAVNGEEALKLFRESAPGEFDIILMDMQMPVMDGCTAAAEIRKLARTDAGSVQIYACTANTFQEDRERAIQSGMDDFLTKPIDVNVLLKKMGKAVKDRQICS